MDVVCDAGVEADVRVDDKRDGEDAIEYGLWVLDWGYLAGWKGQ